MVTTVVATSTVDQFRSVVTLNVLSARTNWDADAEYDEVAIDPALVDGNDKLVEWHSERLLVDIEIYTTRSTDEGRPVKDKVVYTGRGDLTDYKDAQLFMGVGHGIRVPFDLMTVPPGERYSSTLATVCLPDGRTFSDIDLATALAP